MKLTKKQQELQTKSIFNEVYAALRKYSEVESVVMFGGTICSVIEDSCFGRLRCHILVSRDSLNLLISNYYCVISEIEYSIDDISDLIDFLKINLDM